MKTLLLVAGGRGGSDFFQGLLDGHSQILSFPLYIRINDFLLKLLDVEDPIFVARKFIKLYPEFFDSYINKFERHHRLGKNKNKSFHVNKNNFIKNYFFLVKKKKLSRFNKLKFLHLAYSKTRGENIKIKKVLFIHTHLLDWTQKFIKEIKPHNFEIIHIIRHPLASLSSPIKNWLKFQKGKNFFPKDLFFQLNLVFNGIFDLMKLARVKIIRFEDLHWNHKKTMIDFCKKFNLRYEKKLLICTKNGLLWWGDSVSKKWLTGVNSNYHISIDSSYFFERDLFFFQTINNRIIRHYNYRLLFDNKKILTNFLPMKCEILVWKNTIKHFYLNFRWKHLISIPYFYLLRVFMINYFTMKKQKLPYCFGRN